MGMRKRKLSGIFIAGVYTALGVSVGTEDDPKALNMTKLRYHKVIIMTDADVDGSHIATPPLYRVKKGNIEEYCWTDEERSAAIERIGKGRDTGLLVSRYKGLGEMDAEQLWATTMDPEKRILRQVHIENAAEADRIFSMLMGDDVPPRREFIEQNAKYANIDA